MRGFFLNFIKVTPPLDSRFKLLKKNSPLNFLLFVFSFFPSKSASFRFSHFSNFFSSNNNKGFSILGVLIASAIGLIVMTGINQMLIHFSTNIKQLENSLKKTQYSDHVASTFKQHCTATLSSHKEKILAGDTFPFKKILEDKSDPTKIAINLDDTNYRKKIARNFGVQGHVSFKLSCATPANCVCSTPPCTKDWRFDFISQRKKLGSLLYNKNFSRRVTVTTDTDSDGTKTVSCGFRNLKCSSNYRWCEAESSCVHKDTPCCSKERQFRCTGGDLYGKCVENIDSCRCSSENKRICKEKFYPGVPYSNLCIDKNLPCCPRGKRRCFKRAPPLDPWWKRFEERFGERGDHGHVYVNKFIISNGCHSTCPGDCPQLFMIYENTRVLTGYSGRGEQSPNYSYRDLCLHINLPAYYLETILVK